MQSPSSPHASREARTYSAHLLTSEGTNQGLPAGPALADYSQAHRWACYLYHFLYLVAGRDHSIPLQCYFKIGVLAVFYVSRYTVTPAAVCDLFEVRSIPGSGRCARLVISRKMHILAQVCCQNTMLAHSNLNILKCHPT